MPIYEYRCDSCDAVVEKLQRFSDPPLSECDSCGGKLTKLISAPGLQFKGTGWYVTDYAGKSNGKSGAPGENGTGAGAADKAKAETKSDSKPKSESKPKSDSKPAQASK